MPRFLMLLPILLLSMPMFAAPGAAQVSSRVLMVGQGQPFPSLSVAARAARPGDTIRILSGTYAECVIWAADNLIIQATPGTVRLEGAQCAGNAVFVLRGNDITVDGLEFINSRLAERNGTAIRVDGRNAVIRRTTFRSNEQGIFAANVPGSTLTVDRSSFFGLPGNLHSIQINAGFIDRLTVRDSVFRNTYSGAHIKSRAANTEVTGSTIEDGSGGASLLIDIANGGNALIRDNRLQKSARATSMAAAIAIGAEGLKHPTNNLVVTNNSFRNDTGRRVILVLNRTNTPVRVGGNVFGGAPVEEVLGRSQPMTIPPAAQQGMADTRTRRPIPRQ